MTNHPKAEHINALATGRLGGAEARTVVAHLIHGCADCGAAVAQYFESHESESAYDEACDHAFAAVATVLNFRRAPLLQRAARPQLWS